MNLHRKGLSLIELLVVVAILSAITSILLPAVQLARESARRITCSNHLRQIGVGLSDFHATFQHFPMGCLEWQGLNPDNRQLAWNASILPFIEQKGLYNSIDFKMPYDSATNHAAATTRLPVFRCPSSQRIEVDRNSIALSDYGGVYGERISSPNSPPKGVMLIDRVVAAKEITDGLSNTLIVAEDSKSSQGEWINGANIFDQAFSINSGPDFENDIRSDHPGGANTIFCDGSTHFLENTTDNLILAAHCTRAGHEF
ncbi:MAG: DUF1559 domain-containing protein [Planctomycetota bacterium]